MVRSGVLMDYDYEFVPPLHEGTRHYSVYNNKEKTVIGSVRHEFLENGKNYWCVDSINWSPHLEYEYGIPRHSGLFTTMFDSPTAAANKIWRRWHGKK